MGTVELAAYRFVGTIARLTAPRLWVCCVGSWQFIRNGDALDRATVAVGDGGVPQELSDFDIPAYAAGRLWCRPEAFESTSLEDRFWLAVICADHQTCWSVARLSSGVSLCICPYFSLLARGWPGFGPYLTSRPSSYHLGAIESVKVVGAAQPPSYDRLKSLLIDAVAALSCCISSTARANLSSRSC